VAEENESRRNTIGLEPTGAVVEAWMRHAEALDPMERFDHFESAFAAIWERARVPLGGITLVASLDRVLANAKDRFRALEPVSVDASGAHFAGLRAAAHLLSQGELREMFRFLLVEFVSLLGALTGDILTPTLHATL
jgi:hypothetical protein